MRTSFFQPHPQGSIVRHFFSGQIRPSSTAYKELESTTAPIAPDCLQPNKNRQISGTNKESFLHIQDKVLPVLPAGDLADPIPDAAGRLLKDCLNACRLSPGLQCKLSGRGRPVERKSYFGRCMFFFRLTQRSPWRERTCSKLGIWHGFVPVASHCTKTAWLLICPWKHVVNRLLRR